MFRSERGLCPRNRVLGGGSEGGRSPPPRVLASTALPRRDLLPEVGGARAAIAALEGGDGPVASREPPAAAPRPARASSGCGRILLHRPVVGQLLADLDGPPGHEGELPADAEVRLARVVDEELVAADLGRAACAHEEVVVHLEVRVGDAAADAAEGRAAHDVAALDSHDLALRDGTDGEKAAPVYRAPPDGGLGRAVGFRHAAPGRTARRYSTSRIISISTGMPLGSSAIPTAERAWRPCSPKTSTMRSEKPLMTLGCSPKPSAELTMPSTLTMRLTLSRLPSMERAVPRRLTPTSRATL